jgi:hypothetical protein
MAGYATEVPAPKPSGFPADARRIAPKLAETAAENVFGFRGFGIVFHDFMVSRRVGR